MKYMVMVVLCIAAFMTGCMSVPVPGEPGQHFREYQEVFSARQIAEAFEANHLAAQWEYSGKTCKGFGRILRVESERERHRIYFELGDPMQRQIRRVQHVCIELTPDELNRISYTIRANDIIWVEGTLSRFEEGVVVIRDITRYQLQDRITPDGYKGRRIPRHLKIEYKGDPRLYGGEETEVGEPEPID